MSRTLNKNMNKSSISDPNMFINKLNNIWLISRPRAARKSSKKGGWANPADHV